MPKIEMNTPTTYKPAIDLPDFDAARLVGLLLDQFWHYECEIIPDYMPPYPRRDTVPSCVLRHPKTDSFLCYSRGPQQGFYWDVGGDDLHTVELAILALAQAPTPLFKPYVKFEFPLPPKDVPDKESIEKLLDETYRSMAVLARKIEAGDEAAREPWEKLNERAEQLERKIGAALEAEYMDEMKAAKETEELLDRIDTILAEDETD